MRWISVACWLWRKQRKQQIHIPHSYFRFGHSYPILDYHGANLAM